MKNEIRMYHTHRAGTSEINIDMTVVLGGSSTCKMVFRAIEQLAAKIDCGLYVNNVCMRKTTGEYNEKRN